MAAKGKLVVLITGCGSGLGWALAKRLHDSKEYRVVATARDAKSVERIRIEMPESESFRVEQLDITSRDERESVIAKVLHSWKAIHILINNAGVSYRSVVEHMDDESELKQMDVNYLAPMALIRLLVPGMREAGFGKIINVSSVCGMISMPTMASYSASKHALEGATEALWYELKPYGISVTTIQPGFIRSPSFEKVYFAPKAKLSRELDGPYSEYYSYMGDFVARFMHRSFSTPEKIAARITKVIPRKKPKLWVPVTIDAQIFFWLRRLLPRDWFHRFMFLLLPSVRKWGTSQRNLNRGVARPLDSPQT